MEEDAILVGLDLHYYWSLTPKQWSKYIKVYNEKKKREFNEQDTLNYILGKYIAYSVNDPKHYPKNPFTDINVNMSNMSDDDMETMARKNTIKMGGVINDN